VRREAYLQFTRCRHKAACVVAEISTERYALRRRIAADHAERRFALRSLAGLRQPHNHHEPVSVFCQHIAHVSASCFGARVFLISRALGSVSDWCVSFERFSLCRLTVGLLPRSSSGGFSGSGAFALR
jgi:hypothetical protein